MNEKEMLKNYEPNEFIKIMTGEGTVEEKITATYIRALEPDCFDFYVPRREPFRSKELQEEYQDYLNAPAEKKSDIWRRLTSQKEHIGYFKAKDEVDSENNSNLHFLTEMENHFKAVGLLAHAEKCRIRILDFNGVM